MKLQLIERKIESLNVESFIFEPETPFSWQAGQFLHYVLHHEPTDERGSDRWFTVASAPHEKKVLLTTRFAQEKESSFKHSLYNLNIGDTIEISDVDGDFVVKDLNAEYVFIAGGIGITPFRAILKDLEQADTMPCITLLYANKDTDIPYKQELETIAKQYPHVQIHYIFSPKRIDAETIANLVPHITSALFYVSGPESMVESLGTILKDMSVSDDHIKQDWFPGYMSYIA